MVSAGSEGGPHPDKSSALQGNAVVPVPRNLPREAVQELHAGAASV